MIQDEFRRTDVKVMRTPGVRNVICIFIRISNPNGEVQTCTMTNSDGLRDDPNV